MLSKKVVIIAQVLISGMMAFLMTGFFSILHFGFTPHMLDSWVGSFAIGWPVAFCFSLLVSPLAFMISGRLFSCRAPVAVE